MDALIVELSEPARAAHLILVHDPFSAAESRHNLTMDNMDGLRFWIARLGREVVGCGATRPLGGGEEIKSMHVAETARDRDALAPLSRLLAAAREGGVTALCLETGSSPGFAAARRFYARRGFAECGRFGDDRADPHSSLMELALSPPR